MGFELNDWKVIATTQHENFQNLLGDRYWDRFNLSEEVHLEVATPPRILLFQKISQAIYGPPKKETADCGLEEKQIKLVNEIIEKCVKHSVSKEYIDFACIFVCVYIDNDTQTTVPLFRVRSVEIEKVNEIPNCKFIDHIGRVYDSLEHYKSNNTWNMAYLCLPTDGYYSLERFVDKDGEIYEMGEKGVIFLDQLERGKYENYANKASTVTGLGSTVGMIAGLGMTFFPATAPFAIATMAYSGLAGTPGAIYGTAKSIQTLVDRKKHEQSINITDSEARACWLTTAVSAVSIGTMASTRYLLNASKGGNLVSNWVRVGVTGMSATSITLSGVNVGNMFYNLYEKKKMGEEITSLDVFQLTTSIFFFTHSAVNFQTANGIIKEIHKQEADSFRMTLNKKEQKRFDAMMAAHKETIKPGQVRELEGQASFVRELHRIDNVKDYMKQFRFTPDKQFRINNEYTMSPRKFVTLTDDQRSTIMTNSQKLRSGEITYDQFKQNTQNIRRVVRINSDRETIDAANNLRENNGIDVKKFKINGKNYKLKPHEINELNSITKKTDANVLQFAHEFAEQTNPKNPNEYMNAVKYATRNSEKGIASQSGQMIETFNDLRKNYEANHNTTKFRNSQSAVNHLDKHANEFVNANDSNAITMEKYIEIADEMINETPAEMHWTADGSGINCKYLGEDGECCITYTPIGNDGLAGEQVVVSMYKGNNCIDSKLVNID